MKESKYVLSFVPVEALSDDFMPKHCPIVSYGGLLLVRPLPRSGPFILVYRQTPE